MSIGLVFAFLAGACFACLVTFLIDAFTSPYGPVQKWGRIQ